MQNKTKMFFLVFVVVFSVVFLIPGSLAAQACTLAEECSTNPCSGSAVCLGTCAYLSQVSEGTPCLGDWGHCAAGGDGVNVCTMNECSKPNRVQCPENWCCGTSADSCDAMQTDQAGKSCCDTTAGNTCIPETGNACYGTTEVSTLGQDTGETCSDYASAPGCYGAWVNVYCDDSGASDLAGHNVNYVYHTAITEDEFTISDVNNIVGSLSVDESQDFSDVAEELAQNGAVMYLATAIEAENTMVTNHDLYFGESGVVTTLINDNANEEYRDDTINKCACEGTYKRKILYKQPDPVYLFQGVFGGLMSSFFAFAGEEVSDIILAGTIVQIDISINKKNQCFTDGSGYESHYLDISSLDTLVLAAMFASAFCGGDTSCPEGLALGYFIADDLGGGFVTGVMDDHGGADWFKSTYVSPDNMASGIVINYDAANMREACERDDCGGGVYDSGLAEGYKCCGDDKADDPDSSRLFCVGKNVNSGVGATTERSCRLGNLGSVANQRSWVGAQGSGTNPGMCCGDDTAIITQGTVGAADDCAYVLPNGWGGWGYEQLCWMDEMNSTTEWKKSNFQGFIYYIPCANLEVMTDGYNFIACGDGLTGGGGAGVTGATIGVPGSGTTLAAIPMGSTYYNCAPQGNGLDQFVSPDSTSCWRYSSTFPEKKVPYVTTRDNCYYNTFTESNVEHSCTEITDAGLINECPTYTGGYFSYNLCQGQLTLEDKCYYDTLSGQQSLDCGSAGITLNQDIDLGVIQLVKRAVANPITAAVVGLFDFGDDEKKVIEIKSGNGQITGAAVIGGVGGSSRMDTGDVDPWSNSGRIRNSLYFANPTSGNRQYLCHDEKGKGTIAYCGDEDIVTQAEKGAGGELMQEGGSIISGASTWYCAHYSEFNHWNFTSDLDSLDERGDTDGSACDEALSSDGVSKAGFFFTGTYCCAEDDDNTQSPYGESYNEDAKDNFGACFRNVYQPNEDSSKNRLDGKPTDGFLYYDLYNAAAQKVETLHKYEEVYVSNGTFHGCAISDTIYANEPGKRFKPYQGSLSTWGLSNDFLLSDTDKPNPGGGGASQGKLITDHDYCDTIGPVENNGTEMEEKYFCSYEEVWKETNGDDSSHLNYIPWVDNNVQQAECCGATQCWNGSICVDSVHDDLDAKPIRGPSPEFGWRCVLGNWIASGLKYTWDNSKAGFCPQDSQCLVDPSGSFTSNDKPEKYGGDSYDDNPICINDSQYIMDHYCEDGNWTSRTKLVGLELLEESNGESFELFCDEHENVLNYVKYDPGGPSFVPLSLGLDLTDVFIEPYEDARCKDAANNSISCANNFCVFVDPEKVVLGTSLNRDLKPGTRYNFLEVLEIPTGHCNETVGSDVDEFIDCSGVDEYGGTTFFNPKKKLLIYSKNKGISPGTDKGYVELFLSLIFRDFLKPMIDALTGRGELEVYDDFNFFDKNSKEANKLYFAKTNEGKKVFGIREEKFNSPQGEMSMLFSVDFLNFDADICDALRSKKQDVYCFNETAKKTYRVTTVPKKEADDKFNNLWVDLTARLRPNKMMQRLSQPETD